MSVDEAHQARGSKGPEKVDFWTDFQSGRLIKLGEEAKPDFLPKSDVGTTIGYGMQLYQKLGFVPETELLRLTGCTPKMLKSQKEIGSVNPISVKLDGPAAPSTVLFPISLKGLPSHEVAGVIKGKIFHNVVVNHSERVLRSEDQITQKQGVSLFNMTAKALHENRPLMRDHGKVPTVEKLCEIKKKLELEQTADANPEESEAESEQSEGNSSRPVPRKGKAFHVGSLATAVKAKAKPKTQSKAGANKAFNLKGSSGGRQEREPSPTPSSSKHGKTTKNDRLLQEAIQVLGTDQEMIRVAKRHLNTEKGSSASCLQLLHVPDILAGSKPGQAISGAGMSKDCCLEVVGFQVYYVLAAAAISLYFSQSASKVRVRGQPNFTHRICLEVSKAICRTIQSREQ